MLEVEFLGDGNAIVADEVYASLVSG